MRDALHRRHEEHRGPEESLPVLATERSAVTPRTGNSAHASYISFAFFHISIKKNVSDTIYTAVTGIAVTTSAAYLSM